MLDGSLYALPVGRQDFGSVNPEIRIIEGRIIEVLLYFVSICFPPTFYSNMVHYFGVPFAGYSFCVLFFLHFYSKTQDTQSADTQPVHGH